MRKLHLYVYVLIYICVVYLCVCIYGCVYVYIHIHTRFLKEVAFPSGQLRDLRHVPWICPQSAVTGLLGALVLSAKWRLLDLPSSCVEGSDQGPHIRLRVADRELPPGHLRAITEWSPSAENYIRCSVSGMTVLLLVCTIFSCWEGSCPC